MRLENFLALTQATLINEPCVHSFENIVFEAHKVKRGDLFFAYEHENIKLAIVNGAYGVIFDKPTQISDNEIAWIKVDSLDYALKKLLRFKMIEKEIVAYECNEIILKLSLQVITQATFLTLTGDLKSVFKSIWDVENRTTVLFSPALSDKEIFATVKKIANAPFAPIEIMEQTLFETSFIYDNTFYERQPISPFFIPYLEELLHLYKTLKVSYKLKKFTPIEHFEPVFTNKKFEIKNFGTSDKVLIFEPNIDLIDSQISFLQRHASWANIIFIAPLNVKTQEIKNIFTYKNEKDIISILKNNNFNFALIVGVDKTLLSKPLSNQTQLTMDF
jgi:ferrochelatase